MIPSHCWIVGIGIVSGNYQPCRESTRFAKREGATIYFSYADCEKACNDMQALKEKGDTLGQINYGKESK